MTEVELEIPDDVSELEITVRPAEESSELLPDAQDLLREALPLLVAVADFLEDEADNRAAAGGSAASDYEQEPRDLADRIDYLLTRLRPLVAPAEARGGTKP